jgi:hypothetical protein
MHLPPLQQFPPFQTKPIKPFNPNLATRRGRIVIEDVEGDEFDGGLGVERVMLMLAEIPSETLAKAREVYDHTGCLHVIWRTEPSRHDMEAFEMAWMRRNEQLLQYTMPDGTGCSVTASLCVTSTRKSTARDA